MKRTLFFAAVLAISVMLFGSCEKENGSNPNPTPSPSTTATIRIDAEGTADILSMLDFTGSEFKFGNQTIDISNLSCDKTFTVTETTQGSLTVVAKPKAGFSPAEGKTYDAVCHIEIYCCGSKCFDRELNLRTFDYEREKQKENPRPIETILSRWCSRLAANYTYTVNPNGSFSDFGK